MTSSTGIALVTGAGGTLGTQIVHALARRVHAIAINDIDAAVAEQLSLSVEGCKTGVFSGNVANPTEAASIVEAVIGRFGSVDVLVNAAGIEGPLGPIESLKPEEVEQVFSVNVLSMFWMCSLTVPGFKTQGGGRIVNIASGAGLAGGALTSPYNASKHAVVGLTRSLARELAPFDIPVNAVCPGYVDSPMIERIAANEAGLTGEVPDFAAAVPMGRLADAGEVATTVLFLATEAPTYLTGTCLVLDGALGA